MVESGRQRLGPAVWSGLLGVTIAVVVTSLMYVLRDVALVAGVQGQVLDTQFRVRGARSPGDQIVIITVDDRSLAGIGQWTWDRTIFADMVGILDRAGARIIAFDLLFSEPDRAGQRSRSRRVIEAALRWHEQPSAQALQGLRTALSELRRKDASDHRLADALAQAGNVVLPLAFVDHDPGDSAPSFNVNTLPLGFEAAMLAKEATLTRLGTHVLPPLSKLSAKAAAVGHVNVLVAGDGTARFEYPIAAYAGTYVPSMGLSIARLAAGTAPARLRMHPGAYIGVAEDRRLWTDERMRTVVNFYGPAGTFPTYSFVDVLRQRIPAEIFSGRICLIGWSATGISDTFRTPYSAGLPGTERIATVVRNILDESSILRRQFYWVFDGAISILAALGLALAAPSLTTRSLLLLSAALMAAIGAGYQYAFEAHYLWLSLVTPLMAIVLTAVALIVRRSSAYDREFS